MFAVVKANVYRPQGWLFAQFCPWAALTCIADLWAAVFPSWASTGSLYDGRAVVYMGDARETFHCTPSSFPNTVQILQSHHIDTQSRWSSGSTLCFPSLRTRVQSPGGFLMRNRDYPVSVISLQYCTFYIFFYLFTTFKVRGQLAWLSRPTCIDCVQRFRG
jgi:hypothetical protein